MLVYARTPQGEIPGRLHHRHQNLTVIRSPMFGDCGNFSAASLPHVRVTSKEGYSPRADYTRVYTKLRAL